MLSRKNFVCKRCGECCKKYIIRLYNDDIKKIKKVHPSDYFVEKLTISGLKDYVLRKINGKCVFLKKKQDEYFCEIYPIRPKICRQYPFFGGRIDSCKPVTIEAIFRRK